MGDSLPDQPHLEWLRKQAKRELETLRQSNPRAQLSEAQLHLARRYGFASWRALKSHVDRLNVEPLVSSALEQAERSPAAVRAAALLSVARVVRVRNHDEAMHVLERGIATVQTLREPARRVLMTEAFTLAAMISPDRALQLLPEINEDAQGRHRIAFALQQMFEQGEHELAIRYLLGAPDEPGFPYDAMDSALHLARDDRTRAALLQKAIRAARSTMRPGHSSLPHDLSEMLRLFSDHWRLLPVNEARDLVRDFVATIVAAPDERGQFTIQGARFSSTRQHLLFTLFGPCRHLQPQLADSLVVDHAQLAKAVANFPYGLESIYEREREPVPVPASDEPPEPRPEPDRADLARMDYLSLDEFLPVAEELRTNFDRAFKMAMNAYAKDTNPRRPNLAPQQCWPSAQHFRSILHKAGYYEGRDAMRHLDRIPDPSLRLFAQIELAAALADLPQAPGMSMTLGPEPTMPAPFAPPGHHDAIDESMLQQLMPPPFAGKPDVPPSYEVSITPSRHPAGTLPTGGCDADFWVIQGARLRAVLADLFDVSHTRIVLPSSLEHERYDFTLVLPQEETREVLLERMRAGVERYFDVKRERQTIDVQVLTAPRGVRAPDAYTTVGGGMAGISGGSFDVSQPLSFSSMPDFEGLTIASLMDLSFGPSARRSMNEEMRVVKQRFLRSLSGTTGVINSIHQSLTMGELCVMLEAALNRVFLDDTGSTASYHIDVEANAADSQAFLEVLCDELGLVVTPGRRDVEMVVVGPRVGP